MSNYINIKNNKVVLSFKYDPNIVMSVKSIDGRVWNKTNKQWEIPIDNINEVIDILSPIGFIPSSLVLEEVKKREQFLNKIESIKDGNGEKYTGSLPLFDFQHKGASFLKNMPYALLADVPGLGKTIQTIASTEQDKQILIFCPASLKYNWKEEIEKWLPKSTTLVINGNKQERENQWKISSTYNYKYIIANYELLIHDFELIHNKHWPVIVCDEATRVSNPSAKTTQRLYTLKSDKRIALTGTPISNSPQDIYGIFQWLVPGYLGTFNQFKQKYLDFVDSGWGYDKIIGYKNLNILKQKVDRFMIRRTKEEVFKDFPKKIVENIIFDQSESERKLYNFIKEQIVHEIQKLGDLDTRTLGIIPVKMLRLKQCTGHTSLVGADKPESSKLGALRDILDPIYNSGEKTIIFTQFSEMLKILHEDLSEYEPFVIYGEIDSETRMETVKRFNDKKGGGVIIMTEAGAYGLNMQSASYVVHYDCPWSVAKLMQREDRAHRIGQNKPVTVYNLVAKNTIDEYILKVLHLKQKTSVDVLADADRLSEIGLSVEDINEILRL